MLLDFVLIVEFPGIDTEYFVKQFCTFLKHIMMVLDFHELK